MRVVVLGASGLIGTAGVRALARRGHEPVVVVRDPARAPRGATRAVTGDIREPEAWIGALDGADALIHCAADWSGDTAASDARLVSALLGSGFGGRILYTGGVWLFGPSSGEAIAESTPFAAPHAFRWLVEGWERLAAGHADAVCVHPGLVWGTGQRLPGRPVRPGTQRWPLVEADDLGEAYADALERGRPGEGYLAVAETVRAADVARAAGLALAEPAEGDTYAWDQPVDATRARAELGWTPRSVDFLAQLRIAG